jgi:hypothetical protein
MVSVSDFLQVVVSIALWNLGAAAAPLDYKALARHRVRTWCAVGIPAFRDRPNRGPSRAFPGARASKFAPFQPARQRPAVSDGRRCLRSLAPFFPFLTVACLDGLQIFKNQFLFIVSKI